MICTTYRYLKKFLGISDVFRDPKPWNPRRTTLTRLRKEEPKPTPTVDFSFKKPENPETRGGSPRNFDSRTRKVDSKPNPTLTFVPQIHHYWGCCLDFPLVLSGCPPSPWTFDQFLSLKKIFVCVWVCLGLPQQSKIRSTTPEIQISLLNLCSSNYYNRYSPFIKIYIKLGKNLSHIFTQHYFEFSIGGSQLRWVGFLP